MADGAGVGARGFRDLKVYQLAYRLAMEVFRESKTWAREERFLLTDQARRSSRSVPTNTAEGYRRRRYPNIFVLKLGEADGEATETQVSLDFAHDCGYLASAKHQELIEGYEEVGRMLGGMINHPERFCP